jgi:hypothetical protein
MYFNSCVEAVVDKILLVEEEVHEVHCFGVEGVVDSYYVVVEVLDVDIDVEHHHAFVPYVEEMVLAYE